MQSPKVIVRDGHGKEVKPRDSRPTAHSPTLNTAVDAMVAASDRYYTNVEKDLARINYTGLGRTEMQQVHGRTALAALAEAYRAAKQQAVGELAIADDRFNAALRNRLPPADVVRVEIGKQLLADERGRGLLVAKVESDTEITFEDVERIEAGAVLPLSLTGLTVAQRGVWRGFLVPEQSAASKRARVAAEYVDELVSVLVGKIGTEASLSAAEVALTVGDAVTDAMRVNYGKRFKEAPMHEVYKAVSATEPLVSGDNVTAGLNVAAVA